jgi:hypothetical protein
MIPLLFAAALAAEGEPLPPAPAPPAPRSDRSQAPAPENPPPFGADVSVGYHAGTVGGPWPQSGVHGTVTARYDAFVVSRRAMGPRLGLSLWGAKTVWPLQQGLDATDQNTVDLHYVHTGILAILRHDPAAPVGLDAGLGFGRLDVEDYYRGPQVLPVLTFEAGPRFRASERMFVDALVRAHWATARSGADPTAMEEWWMVDLGIELGGHLR